MALEGKNETEDAHATALFTQEKLSTIHWGTRGENPFSLRTVLFLVLRVGAVCTTTATKSTICQTTRYQALPCQALLQKAVNNK